MGCTCSKTNNKKPEDSLQIKNIAVSKTNTNKTKISETKYDNITIGSFHVGLDDSSNTTNLIEALTKYFMHNNIDIICLQGFEKYSLIREFVSKLNKNLDNSLILYYAPEIKTNTGNDIDAMDMTWSSSEDFEISDLDLLIISKYKILDFSKIKLKNIINLPNSSKYLIVANILFNNSVISIYNTSFQENLIGVNNMPIRKVQSDQLEDVIISNIEHLNDKIFGDYENKNIHIICGNFNINEIDNNEISREYLIVFKKLKIIDTCKYVAKHRKNNNDLSTNIFGLRSSYICIRIDVDTRKDISIKELTQELHTKSNIFIINSSIEKIEGYENYPITTTFKIKHGNKIQTDQTIQTYEVV